jgi:hypothetical protein
LCGFHRYARKRKQQNSLRKNEGIYEV